MFTEPPFSGKYWDSKEDDTYSCSQCGNPLFASGTKFISKTPGLQGWPAFSDALPGAVAMKPDDTHGMHRTEVVCAKCGMHLGHVFEDIPGENEQKHFCINSTCLDLK